MMSGLFSFGQYGTYIWGAYALCALVLAYNVIAAFRKHRNIERKLRAWLAARGESDQ